jgi:hypothetical protein
MKYIKGVCKTNLSLPLSNRDISFAASRTHLRLPTASLFRTLLIICTQCQLASCFIAGFLLNLFLRPWRWRQYVPPKHRLTLNGLHGVISQKMVLFMIWVFKLVLKFTIPVTDFQDPVVEKEFPNATKDAKKITVSWAEAERVFRLMNTWPVAKKNMRVYYYSLSKGCHLDVVRGPSTPHDPESDAGGSLNFWQGHPSR